MRSEDRDVPCSCICVPQGLKKKQAHGAERLQEEATLKAETPLEPEGSGMAWGSEVGASAWGGVPAALLQILFPHINSEPTL